jgi:hypothetical protein
MIIKLTILSVIIILILIFFGFWKVVILAMVIVGGMFLIKVVFQKLFFKNGSVQQY